MPSNLLLIFVFMVAIVACVWAQAQQQQSVGVLPTIGSEDIDAEELDMLTKNLRTIAANVLPGNAFIVLTQETVMRRLGGTEEYLKVCREGEGCIPSLGKKAEVDYVARCNVVSRGNILRMDCELYNSKTSALIGPFNSYDENPATVDELMSIMGRKAPDMFKKIPGATRIGPPSIVGGISGLESVVPGAIDLEKNYLINLTTDPVGAALSFNGVPVASCVQSPCRVELPEGRIRMIAALEQYETADTTVSLVRNNQSVSIKLKPNFGVFEVRPAYSDGLGRNEQWNLTINDKSVSSMENRLLPNKYKVKLSHRCYDDINFEVGINKGSYEVFDMSKYIKPKIGGLVLSTERDGEPSSEPVFVNGKNVGETPFSGSVALCADVELGRERVSAKVRLKHNETVRHTQKMPDSREWLAKKEEERRRAQETEAERRRREAEEYRARQIQEMLEDVERKAKRPIRLGLRLTAGGTFGVGLSSEWFDAAYIKDYDIGKSGQGGLGGFFALGLTLNIRITEKWVIATESNYNYFGHFDVYKKEDDNYIAATVSNHTMSIPVLLRFRSHELYAGYYFEAGYQWGFPFSSNVELEVDNSNGKFTDNRDFSEFRTKRDEALVFGLGMFGPISHSFGLRFIYHLTKLDKDGVVKSPTLIGITYAYNIF